MVFQSFNLWSHMTVLQNVIEAPVHVLKRPKAEAVDYADEILQKVGLYDRRDYYPAHLSGGQQQRVAIARALSSGERRVGKECVRTGSSGGTQYHSQKNKYKETI